MSGPVLEYVVPLARRRFVRLAVLVVLAAVALAGGWWTSRVVATERALTREAQRRLTANAPTTRFASCSLTFTEAGQLLLPDGRTASIAELDFSESSGFSGTAATLGAEVERAMQWLHATEGGYTVVGADGLGEPVVQLWVLSPSAYRGICGNSSYEERRQSIMMVWRNVGAFLADRGEFPESSAGRTAPISILGY